MFAVTSVNEQEIRAKEKKKLRNAKRMQALKTKKPNKRHPKKK